MTQKRPAKGVRLTLWPEILPTLDLQLEPALGRFVAIRCSDVDLGGAEKAAACGDAAAARGACHLRGFFSGSAEDAGGGIVAVHGARIAGAEIAVDVVGADVGFAAIGGFLGVQGPRFLFGDERIESRGWTSGRAWLKRGVRFFQALLDVNL